MTRHHTILLPFNNTQPTATVLDAARHMVGDQGYIEAVSYTHLRAHET